MGHGVRAIQEISESPKLAKHRILPSCHGCVPTLSEQHGIGVSVEDSNQQQRERMLKVTSKINVKGR